MVAVLLWTPVVLAAMAGMTILRGAILQTFWTWFAVPAFGVPELSLVNALGIALIVSFLTYQHDARNENERERFVETFSRTVIAGLLICGVSYLSGAVIHAFA